MKDILMNKGLIILLSFQCHFKHNVQIVNAVTSLEKIEPKEYHTYT